MLSFTTLATAWALFSGPTHYISLASAAFFGLGAYAAAILAEQVPWPVVLLARAAERLGCGARRRALDAEAVRRLLRHLHVRTGRARAPARDLVRGQHQGHRRPLPVPRYVAGRDLLAAAGADGGGVCHRLAGRPLAPGARGPRHRRRRGRRTAQRHRYDARQGRAVCAQLRHHGADGRDHGAALDLHRSRDRLQPDDLVPGRHHGAARGRGRAVRAGAGRRYRWCCCSRC